MTIQIMCCIGIFALMMVSFAWNKFPLGVTALAAMLLLVFTKCMDAKTALSNFGSANAIIIAGMFVIGAGLKKLSIIGKVTGFIRRITGGSFKWSYRGVIVLAILLTSFLTSPGVAYAIVFPIMDSICDEFGVSRSKYQFPLAAACVACCAILPFGFAISEAAVFNGLMETYGFTQGFTPMDFTRGRLPILFVVIIWAFFLADKFTPEKPVIPIVDADKKASDSKPLSPLQDTLGAIIFAGTILGLVFNTQLGIPSWVFVVAGGVLYVICGVMSGKEAVGAIAIDLGFMFVGANAMAQALVQTGSADYIGEKVSALLGSNPSNLLMCVIFFLVPFILTQFMQNQGVMNIFAPICLLICSAVGADPRGCLVLICAGSLTAFMTPSATAAIPMVMGAGGYDVKTLVKMSWLLSIILAVCYIAFVSITMPAF